jgi:hypothetical protein
VVAPYGALSIADRRSIGAIKSRTMMLVITVLTRNSGSSAQDGKGEECFMEI